MARRREAEEAPAILRPVRPSTRGSVAIREMNERLEMIQTQLGRPSEWNDLHSLFSNTLSAIYGRMEGDVNKSQRDQLKLKKKTLAEALGGALYDQVERQQRREQLIRMGFLQDPDYELIMRRMTGLMGSLTSRRIANKFYGTETRGRTHGGARRYPIEGRPEYGSKFSLFGHQVVPVDARPMKYLNPRTELRQKMKIIRKFLYIIFY